MKEYKILIKTSKIYGLCCFLSIDGTPTKTYHITNSNRKTILINGNKLNCINYDDFINLFKEIKNNISFASFFNDGVKIRTANLPKKLKVEGINEATIKFGNLSSKTTQEIRRIIEKNKKNIPINLKVTSIILVIALATSLVCGLKKNNNSDIDNSPNISYSDEQQDIDTDEYTEGTVIKIDLSNCAPSDNRDETKNTANFILAQKDNSTLKTCEQIIDEYSSMFGIDKRIILAIACQESSDGHDSNDIAGDIGQMQIRRGIWENYTLRVTDINGNSVEETITLEKLTSLESNIKIGCMILRNYLNSTNNNLLLAIMCYNMGPGTMEKICNCSLKEVAYHDISYLNKTDGHGGDPEYLQHILYWLGIIGEDEPYEIICKNGDVLIFDLNLPEVKSKQ